MIAEWRDWMVTGRRDSTSTMSTVNGVLGLVELAGAQPCSWVTGPVAVEYRYG
jgi:hypothetical protein